MPLGQDQCYDEMCFAVTGVDEIPGLVAGDATRVVRVTIRVSNHDSVAHEESRIHAYLVDATGRTWQPLPGLSGNRLDARIAGSSEMFSRPLFSVAQDASGLGLVMTHGRWQRRRLIIGDSDSIGHRPTIVALGR